MASDDDVEVVTLWRPTGQAELDLVAASGHRAWPPRLPDQPIFYPVLNRAYATKITREWNAPRGVGYVTSFDVRRDFIARYGVHCVGAKEHVEYWIPSEDLAELNANIVGRIREVAAYRGGVDDLEFRRAEKSIGLKFPSAWRAWQQSRSFLWHGLLENA
jgi:hypothetical protein